MAKRTRYTSTVPVMAYPEGRLVRVDPAGQASIVITPRIGGPVWNPIGPATDHPWITGRPTMTAKAARARTDWPTT